MATLNLSGVPPQTKNTKATPALNMSGVPSKSIPPTDISGMGGSPSNQSLNMSGTNGPITPTKTTFENPLAIPKAEAADTPKLTPEKLQQLRAGADGQPISSSSIAKFYAGLNPDFKRKYESGAGQSYNISGPDGKPLSWDDIALNMEAYGNPTGPGQPPAQHAQGGGVMGAIGNGAKAIWDYATAPVDALGGAVTKAAGAAFGKDVSQDPLVKNLDSNVQQTADIAPMIGATIGSAAGPLGTAAGAAIGSGAGNLIKDVNKASKGQEINSLGTNLKDAAISGTLNGVTDGAFTYGAPLFKKLLIKGGAVATNVADDVMERAFNHPQIVSNAIKEISSNVKEPFLKLSQQIGNTLKSKIDDAGAAIGKAKEFILQNNPGAKYDVSATTSDLSRVLKENNLSLSFSPGKKAPLILNEAGDISGIAQGPAKPLSDAEINGLTEYVKTINKAKDYSINDVLDLKKLYNRIYNEIGTNDIGTTSNGQRILRSLRETVDEKIGATMPDTLKTAYADFSKAMTAHEDFPHFLTSDNKGKLVLKEGGEKYLNTLGTMNRGQRRENLQKLSDFVGFDIEQKAQFLKDAQALYHLFPQTGGREKDVLASFIINKVANASAGAGAGLGIAGVPHALLGAAGGAVAAAATSPRIVGSAVRGAGKIAGSRAFKSIMGLQKTLAPAERQALLMLLNGGVNSVENQ